MAVEFTGFFFCCCFAYLFLDRNNSETTHSLSDKLTSQCFFPVCYKCRNVSHVKCVAVCPRRFNFPVYWCFVKFERFIYVRIKVFPLGKGLRVCILNF